VQTKQDTRTGLGRRSDRWAGARTNPWAIAGLVCAVLGLAAVGVIATATADVSWLASLPDEAGYLLYGAVPSLGVLALALGVVAVGRGRARWLAVAAIVIGSLEVVVSIAAIVVLLNATRSL
jgi:hypothetical protein